PVTLTVTPAEGMMFLNWGGSSCAGTNPTCSFTMSGTASATAKFAPLSRVTATVTGSGTVSGSGIDCGATCSVWATPDSSLTFTATPSTGYALLKMGGDCAGSTGTCQTTAKVPNTSVIATFAAVLTVTAPSHGTLQ